MAGLTGTIPGFALDVTGDGRLVVTLSGEVRLDSDGRGVMFLIPERVASSDAEPDELFRELCQSMGWEVNGDATTRD